MSNEILCTLNGVFGVFLLRTSRTDMRFEQTVWIEKSKSKHTKTASFKGNFLHVKRFTPRTTKSVVYSCFRIFHFQRSVKTHKHFKNKVFKWNYCFGFLACNWKLERIIKVTITATLEVSRKLKLESLFWKPIDYGNFCNIKSYFYKKYGCL